MGAVDAKGSLPDDGGGGGLPSSANTSGAVRGNVVQVGSLSGGLHIHGPGEDFDVPRQLPAVPGLFVGRHAELAFLDASVGRRAAASPVVIAISGPGGIGKTTLATTWLHARGNDYPDGHLYADLRAFGGNPSVDPGEVLGHFLRSLGVPSEKVPVEPAHLVNLYRTITTRLRVLVLLDNVVSAAQVRPLLASGRSLCVVTSRQHLSALTAAGGTLLRLNPLSRPDSLDLLSGVLGAERIQRERTAAAELAELCHGVPIALWGAAARLAGRPRRPIEREVGELRDEQRRLKNLSVDETLSVQASFDLSYRALPPRARRLYRLLGLHTGQDFTTSVAAAAAAVPVGEAEELTGLLVNASLLNEVDEDRYRFNDLIRIHAHQCCERHVRPIDRQTALGRVIGWYMQSARNADRIITPYRRDLPYNGPHRPTEPATFNNRTEALHWLETERANLLAITRTAHQSGLAQEAWHLCNALWSLFLYHREYRDRLEIDTIGVASARAWGNRVAEADMVKRLGRLYGLLERYDESIAYLEEAVSINRSIDEVQGEADSLSDLGRVHLDRGDLPAATTALARSLEIHRHRRDDRSTALTLINIGMLSLRQRKHHQALRQVREAVTLLKEKSAADPYNYARALIALGRTMVQVDHDDAAFDYLTEGLKLMRRLGSEYQLAEINGLLGRITEKRGDLRAARGYYATAVQIYVRLGAADAEGLKERMMNLAADAPESDSVNAWSDET